MAVARAQGKLTDKQPKLTPRQQAEFARMYATRRIHNRRPDGGLPLAALPFTAPLSALLWVR
jgi:hypothetical protein